MTIQHKGIRRKTTDVLDDYGQAQYLQNVRLKRVGELGRRAGLGKSNMAQLAGPVQFMIGAWSNTSFIVNGTSGTVTGQEDPLAYWTAATLRLPGGIVGEPAAPVIVSITPSPPSGTPWIVGQVSFTAVINYDGLSGPLTYLWTDNSGGPSTAQPIATTTNPGIFDFDLNCIPGDYVGFILGVATTNNPLLGDSMSFDYTVG